MIGDKFVCHGEPEECMECPWSDCKRPGVMVSEGTPFVVNKSPGRKKMSDEERKIRLKEKNRNYYLRHMELKRKMAIERYHKLKGEKK